MSGLDDWIAGLGGASVLLMATAGAALLGLRHATDPDHLSAVSVLVASESGPRGRRAARLGLAWGAGHATTLIALGLPIVLAAIPDRALAIAALVLFAAFSAIPMALCTGAFGAALGAARVGRVLDRVLPALGGAAAAFGAVYLAGALGVAPHPA